MEISIHARVICKDGDAGTLRCVILNPHTRNLTHIVVREPGLLGQERLVPLDRVLESSPQRVRIDCTLDDLNKMENFHEVRFIQGYEDLEKYEMDEHYFHPYLYTDYEDEYEPLYAEIERIPPGELGIHRGGAVWASDGKIGRVGSFVVSPADHRISHLVLEEGHLWGRKTVQIPVSEVDHIERDEVYLKLDKEAVAQLPSFPLHRKAA